MFRTLGSCRYLGPAARNIGLTAAGLSLDFLQKRLLILTELRPGRLNEFAGLSARDPSPLPRPNLPTPAVDLLQGFLLLPPNPASGPQSF
jgi:hypothetical protein